MRYEIVQLLNEAAPGYVSGEELGRRFRISRTAIWKHIKELRAEGYLIEASSRKGYRLLSSEDRINSFEIARDLGTSVVAREVQFFDTIDSTNNHAKKMAAEGCADGMTVIAGHQTSGRGRLGRDWASPPDKGVYITVVLRPDIAPAQTQVLTLAAAVAAVEAISESVGIHSGIKWPNDIVIDGKKVCGILLEMNSEADRVNYVVIGIGINFSQSAQDFPEEFRYRAISLKMAAESQKQGNSQALSKLSLIRSVLRELDKTYLLVLNDRQEELLDLWRKYSVTIGKEVRFTLRDVEYTGIAVDITADGRLTVDCSDGIRRSLYSGEVSVRGIYEYA